MDTSALAKRMKKYEAVPKNTLIRRTPVIIRVDGRAFHTFTKGFQKPFDDVLMRVMQDTMKYLCDQIQDMLMTQRGINWNDMGTSYKRGSCCVRNRRFISTSVDGAETCEIRNPKEPETAWIIDNDIPIFKGEGRRYIDELIFIGGVEI